ncbi:hypothetical protein PIB30_052699 [Stylosanthes scabra]|uniref:GrpE protein homolog n=1 Tax=Stylosanthes scabra TaxID=79078 RepID=A0ABU6VJY3_9FABA|nr:hypothetical protein [Stylosanthes scabra]
MFVYKALSRVSRTISRSSTLLSASQRHPRPQQFSIFSNHFYSLLPQSQTKLVQVQANLLCPPMNLSLGPRFLFSSSASPDEKEKANNVGDSTNDDPAKASTDEKKIHQGEQAKDSDVECEDLSRDDLIKLVAEKEELLNLKHKEIEKMQDKVLRTYAEMENVMDRTRREAENSKKFAVQNFAKSLLDVADNLGRASSVVKESFSKLDASNDSSEVVKLLKTLLEGVEMTDKQLSEVLKKFGVEKFDPTNEPFDPNMHNAIFQVPDGSKPPGTVAAVLKVGYKLYDRVIRPAEVGVTQAVEEDKNAAE